MKDTYVDYGVLPSRINVKLENHTYKLISNILDRDNGTCEQTSKTTGENYKVEGEVILPPVMAYLCTGDGKNIDTLGSCKMVNGEFKFEGKVDAPKMAYVDYGISYACIHMMLENTTYEITSDALDDDNNSYKTDSKEHGIFDLFLKNDIIYHSKRLDIENKMDAASKINDVVAFKKARAEYHPSYVEQRRAEDVLIKKYPNSLAALSSVHRWRNSVKGDEMIMRFQLLGDKYAHLNVYKELQTRINAIFNSEVGKTVPNFTMEDINGEKISLYDIKGEIKVIDFGASWCAPCRALNPIMLELYNKYNPKGFEIIGVSLDEKREDWVKSVEKDKLPWVQISELKGWDSKIAIDYNVGRIPFMIVLDSQNRILAVDASKDQIEDLLKRMYDEKK